MVDELHAHHLPSLRHPPGEREILRARRWVARHKSHVIAGIALLLVAVLPPPAEAGGVVLLTGLRFPDSCGHSAAVFSVNDALISLDDLLDSTSFCDDDDDDCEDDDDSESVEEATWDLEAAIDGYLDLVELCYDIMASGNQEVVRDNVIYLAASLYYLGGRSETVEETTSNADTRGRLISIIDDINSDK